MSISNLLGLRAEKWENPTDSVGAFIGFLKVGHLRYRCWEATGKARSAFQQLSPQIKDCLEASNIPPSDIVSWSIYMIGHTENTASPRILICSTETKTRKTIRKHIKDSKIMSKHPGIGLGDVSVLPDRQAIRLLSREAIQAILPAGQVVEDAVLAAEENEPLLGMRLFAVNYRDYSLHPITAGPVFLLGDVRCQLTVAHAFAVNQEQADINAGTELGDVDCDLDGMSDNGLEDDEETVMMLQTGSVTSDDMDSDKDSFVAERVSTSVSGSSDEISPRDSIPDGDTSSSVGSTGPLQPAEQEQPVEPDLSQLRYYGSLMYTSLDGAKPSLDYALIKIDSDSVLEDPNRVLMLGKDLSLGPIEGEDAQVVAISPRHGAVYGNLTATPTYIRLPYQNSFQNVYPVRLNQAVADGDCGTAVLDRTTGRFYGHIVAGGPGTGIAYIIPASEVVEDIELASGQKLQMANLTQTRPGKLQQTMPTKREPLVSRGNVGMSTLEKLDRNPEQPGGHLKRLEEHEYAEKNPFVGLGVQKGALPPSQPSPTPPGKTTTAAPDATAKKIAAMKPTVSQTPAPRIHQYSPSVSVARRPRSMQASSNKPPPRCSMPPPPPPSLPPPPPPPPPLQYIGPERQEGLASSPYIPRQMPRMIPPVPHSDIALPTFRLRQRAPSADRSRVQITDIRSERMTDTEMREMLSKYVVYRFEKVVGAEGHDSNARENKPSWSHVVRTLIGDMTSNDISRKIRQLNRETVGVREKKSSLGHNQQRQLEKALEDLTAQEPDPRFHYELVQIDHQLKKIDHHSGSHRKKSRSSASTVKRREKKEGYERVSLTAYYVRCPRPGVDVGLILCERESARERVPPPLLPQQGASYPYPPPPRPPETLDRAKMTPPPPPPPARQRTRMQQTTGSQIAPLPRAAEFRDRDSTLKSPASSPRRLDRHIGIQPPPSHRHARDMRDDDSNSLSASTVDSDSDDDDMWSDDNQSHSTRTDSSRSEKSEHRRRPYLERRLYADTSHFGSDRSDLIRERRQREDEYGRTVAPPIPRVMSPISPPPPREVAKLDVIRADAYEAGRADGRAEVRVDERIANRAKLAEPPFRRRYAASPVIIPAGRQRAAQYADQSARRDRLDDMDDDIRRERLADDRRRDSYLESEWDDIRRRGRYGDDLDAMERRREAEYSNDFTRGREPSPNRLFSNPFTPRVRRSSLATRDRDYRYYP